MAPWEQEPEKPTDIDERVDCVLYTPTRTNPPPTNSTCQNRNLHGGFRAKSGLARGAKLQLRGVKIATYSSETPRREGQNRNLQVPAKP